MKQGLYRCSWCIYLSVARSILYAKYLYPTPIPSLLYYPFTIVLHSRFNAFLFRTAHTPACWKWNRDFHLATPQPIENQGFGPTRPRFMRIQNEKEGNWLIVLSTSSKGMYDDSDGDRGWRYMDKDCDLEINTLTNRKPVELIPQPRSDVVELHFVRDQPGCSVEDGLQSSYNSVCGALKILLQ